MILQQLQHCRIKGRPYRLVASFLANRSHQVRACGVTRNRRDISQGVPQGSVLSPPLFNLAMAAFSRSVSLDKEPHVYLSINADDIVLRPIKPASRTTTVRARLQEVLNAVSAQLNDLGLTLSP